MHPREEPAMKDVEYIGPIDEVVLSTIDRTVKRGDVFKVSDAVAGRPPADPVRADDCDAETREAAAAQMLLIADEDGVEWIHDLGEGLLAQPDNFQLASKKAGKDRTPTKQVADTTDGS